MRNRFTASLAILIPVIVQGMIELGKIVIALIATPSKKDDDSPPST